jgi:predicted alpha/beta superfamily hydrolase
VEASNHTLAGNIKLHPELASRFVADSRNVIVYLPANYQAAAQRRYPVLYLHDGQNLFDPATAFLGNHWGLGEVADELISVGQIQPVILVGIYNTERRMAEYTPVRDPRGRGGRARAYGKMIVEDLKPFIDGTYRTLPDTANTGLGGSSLGGLATLYLGLKYPEVFGKLIVMSPSVWWSNRAIIKEVRKLHRKVGGKIWLDIGTCEGQNPQDCVQNTIALRDALIEKGWQLGQDLAFIEDQGAGHDEKAWGHRMRDALRFLFPPE